MSQTQQACPIRYKSLLLTAHSSHHGGLLVLEMGILRATGVATDSSDNIYVTDGGSPETAVQKFTSNGTFITSWGSTGLGDGQFVSPGGVYVDSSDNVSVSDFGENNRIQKFDSNGNFLVNGELRVPVMDSS